MTTIWTEDQVSLANLVNHLEDCGRTNFSLRDDRISVHTPTGLGLSVFIDEDRKFLRISTYLPTDKTRSRAEKLEMIQRYNYDLFLTSFSLDRDEDVIINYHISFELGLIIGQFMIVLNRFGALVEHIVETLNEDGLIRFNQDDDESEQTTGSDNVEQGASAGETVKLDESRPKDVLLN